jgi:hypothetical protein
MKNRQNGQLKNPPLSHNAKGTLGNPPICSPIANPNFGIAALRLAGRVVELEGRYVF